MKINFNRWDPARDELFTIKDVDEGEVFIDGDGEVMFMTDEVRTSDGDEVDEETQDIFDTEGIVAARMSDGQRFIYGMEDPVRQILEFATLQIGLQ